VPVVDGSEPDERLLVGADGAVLARFRQRQRTSGPFAARFALAAAPERVAAAALAELRGWRIAADIDFGERLIAAGARPLRHSHRMVRDLRREPAPAAWIDPPAPPGFTLTPLDRPAAELTPAYLAAYPPGHPDHADVVDRPESELADLIAGLAVGALLDCSGLAVDARGTVAAAIFVNAEPDGAPLISNVFRRPDAAGTGGALLRRALGLATRDGLPELGLWVTHANPARAVYARLGFADAEEARSVAL
jgi:hypothetical protein